MNCKKYKILFVILSSCLFYNIIRCSDYLVLFNEAIKLYDKAEYILCEQKLNELHNILLKDNKISFEVSYNLGNVNFRLNKLGWARYYYELAKKVNHYDKDVNYNIKLIQKLTQNTDEQSFIEQVVKILSFQHLFFLIFIFNFAFFLSLIIKQSLSLTLWIRRVSLVFLILFGTIGILRCNYEFKKEAIIVEISQMLSSPEESSATKTVVIPEAKKVVVLTEKENFYAVYVLQDKIYGWIKKDKVKLLNIR